MVVSIDKARKKHLSRKADCLHLLIASAARVSHGPTQAIRPSLSGRPSPFQGPSGVNT